MTTELDFPSTSLRTESLSNYLLRGNDEWVYVGAASSRDISDAQFIAAGSRSHKSVCVPEVSTKTGCP